MTAFTLRTGLPPGAVSTHRVHSLSDGWSLTSAQPGVGDIQNSTRPEHGWKSAVVPGTVAMSAGPIDVDAHPRYDELDWWYRCTFTRPQRLPSPTDRVRLRFDGLATLADVRLNGRSILSSCNMFVAHAVDITELLEAENELRRTALARRVEFARRQVTTLKGRVDVGTANPLDLAGAELRLQELQLEMSKADYELALIRKQLGK